MVARMFMMVHIYNLGCFEHSVKMSLWDFCVFDNLLWKKQSDQGKASLFT